MTSTITILRKTTAVLALISLLGLLALQANAQGTASGPSSTESLRFNIGQISGTVLEASSDIGLYAATIGIRSAADSSLVTGAISDADGQFKIERLAPGRYFAVVSFIGYQPFTSPTFIISESNREVDLGTVRLAFNSEQMEGVEVVAERAEVAFEIDRTVYNTKSQISSAGGTATDVLQNVPSIEVDVDGNVSLRGNQNVSILINGKPSPLTGDFLTTFLQQLPASSIDRVEVIPNPSAKYDPDGQAGAINIVLRKDAELGSSGGLTLDAGTDGEYSASGSFNIQKGGLKLFSNYGFRSDDRNSTGYNFRENRYLDPLNFVEQNNSGSGNRTSHLLNMSADYPLSDVVELSGSALVSLRQGDRQSLNAYSQLNSLRDLTARTARQSLEESDGFSMDYSLSFRRMVEASRNETSGEIRYNRSRGQDLDDLSERLLSLDGASALDLIEQTINELDDQEQELILQADAVRSLGKFKVEVGAKGAFEMMDNRFEASFFDAATNGFVSDMELSNRFDYNEDILAAYGIVSSGVGKFDVQVGLRAEQANTNFDLLTTNESFDNSYFSLFPSAYLNYNLTQTKQLKVSYSKRVSRPRTGQLNPFTTFSDPLNLRVGNPRLNPEYIHSVELAYQQFSKLGSISITPYYRRTVNQISRFKTLDNSTGVSTLTYRNFDQSESYGAEIIGSIRLGDRLSGFSSFNAYRIVTEANSVDADLANDAVSWSTRASATWKIADNTDVQLFYFYRAPIDVAQGRISSFSMSNLSIRQRILNDKASLTFKVNDPFDRMGFEFELDQASFYQLGTRKWESRSASITFQYNFGTPPKRQQTRSNQEGGAGFEDIGIG